MWTTGVYFDCSLMSERDNGRETRDDTMGDLGSQNVSLVRRGSGGWVPLSSLLVFRYREVRVV